LCVISVGVARVSLPNFLEERERGIDVPLSPECLCEQEPGGVCQSEVGFPESGALKESGSCGVVLKPEARPTAEIGGLLGLRVGSIDLQHRLEMANSCPVVLSLVGRPAPVVEEAWVQSEVPLGTSAFRKHGEVLLGLGHLTEVQRCKS